MIFCNTCGQCLHINDDKFMEIMNTYGYESRWLDPDTEDVVNWGDSDITDTEHEAYECPYCGEGDIEFQSENSSDSATRLREEYDIQTQRLQLRNSLIIERNKKKEKEWDQ